MKDNRRLGDKISPPTGGTTKPRIGLLDTARISLAVGYHANLAARMTFAIQSLLVIALLASSIGPVHTYVYKTARSLYRDCAAGQSGLGGTSAEKRRRCADYLGRMFNNWNLNQDNGICSQHTGNELPEAYLDYWRARGLGFVPSILTSAEASVNEFLDSQKQSCPMPDPKTVPP